MRTLRVYAGKRFVIHAVQADWSRATTAARVSYDAANVGDELYNSKMDSTRDSAAGAVKFTVPTVVNGKVFVPTNGIGFLRPVALDKRCGKALLVPRHSCEPRRDIGVNRSMLASCGP